MFAIYKKEMRSYFTTPLGYVFIAVFLAVSGFLFAVSTLQSETSDISGFFQFMIFGYIVPIDAVTGLSVKVDTKIPTEMKHMPMSSIAIKQPNALPMFGSSA